MSRNNKMHCTRNLTDDLYWVGGNDRRLSLFEGVYSVPYGVSYNSYLLLDDKTVLFDTVDKAVSGVFFENVKYILNGRTLDYIVVNHMEPDHSAALKDLITAYPDVTVVCNSKIRTMIDQFFDDIQLKTLITDEKSILDTGRHKFIFVSAPMVHWPEVTVTYDTESGILFSADAFGHFGALNGALFADEVDFERDYMDEARRYYCNIVGKYGAQVQSLLKKLNNRKIDMICPLHGFVWRKNIDVILNKYILWSTYEPEEKSVMIVYASIYGNTANAADIIACKLFEKGIKTFVYDVSVTPASEIIATAFRCSHIVLASATYNNGIFVNMENLLHDLVAHNIQNRTVGLLQNGTWAPASGKLMREILSQCKNINIIEETVSLKSALKENQLNEIDDFVSALIQSL